MLNIIEKCYSQAIKVLKENLIEEGFKAAGGMYNNQIWARDACISILGAELTGDEELLNGCGKTLDTLRRGQTKLGMIPNFWSPKYIDYGESGCIDASLWYIIAIYYHYKNTKDIKFLKNFWPSVQKAYQWLNYQDANNFGLLSSQQGGEMWDSSIQRSGKVLYVNVLWYYVLRCIKELSQAREEKIDLAKDIIKVKELINCLFWPTKKGFEKIYLARGKPLDWGKAYKSKINPQRKHYLIYVSFEDFSEYFDTLANSLAILFGVADKEKIKKIIDYAESKNIAKPFPARCLDPVVKDKKARIWDIQADLRRPKHWQSFPYQYWNAGIWPFIGGFYIAALVKAGKIKKAQKYLEKLAELNKKGEKSVWEFNEWFDGKTGQAKGQPNQNWNAGMYLLAYQVVKQNSVIPLEVRPFP
jgi:glycogen debranching enzyme